MKRTLAVLALLIALGGGSAAAQTRVSVSVGFGAPFVVYRPYAYRYRAYRYHYYSYRPGVIIVQPRRHYRPHRRYHRW